jgi:hypothetical protein
MEEVRAIVLVSSAAVFGGIEWALASLGLITLISMIVVGVYIAVKISRYTEKSIYSECLEYARAFATLDGTNQGQITSDIPVQVTPVSKKDRRLIMAHIDELFGIKTNEEGQKSSIAMPLNKRDKKLIMAHINELFDMKPEYSEEKLY